jgi:hypothetical protein
MVGAVLIVTASLAVLALLALALSGVAFPVQTSRHRFSRGWAAAAGASLILVLFFGGIADALQGGAVRASPKGGQAYRTWPSRRTTTLRRRLQGWWAATP